MRRTLRITAGNSKWFYGCPVNADADIDLSGYRGIVAYEPSELVVTAKAGTPLNEIEAVLAEAGQQLPFEPPDYTGTATLGGAVAAGLSGPGRVYAGAVRDSVLGVKMINGRGEVLSFGGQAVKNVAGYDVSRLMVGSFGTLGLLLEISVKTRPLAQTELTLQQTCNAEEAIANLRAVARTPVNVTASAWMDGQLFLRVSGNQPTLLAAQSSLGGERVTLGREFWWDLKNQRQDFFSGTEPLWRVCVPANTPFPNFDHKLVLEWHGALRWIKTSVSADAVRAYASSFQGHAARFDRAGACKDCFQPLPPVLASLHRRIKHAFDPFEIFNPGRMFDACD